MKTIIITILLFFTASGVFAKIWRVNNNSIYTNGCINCFSSLQDVNNSTSVLPGDTIHLEASGTNYNVTTVNKKLVIIGTGYFLNENGSLQQNLVTGIVKGIKLDPGSEGTILTGIPIANHFYPDLEINASNIQVISCYVEGDLYFRNRAPKVLENITIRQCFIKDEVIEPFYPGGINILKITNSYFGRNVELSAKDINYFGTFSNNIVEGQLTGSNGMEYFNNIFKRNTEGIKEDLNSTTNVYNNIFTSSVPSWLSSSSNISIPQATVFVANGSTDGIHQVNPPTICPQCYTGYPNNTEQIGMFGGTTPYVLSGIAPIPTIYELKNRPSSYQGDTIHIKISTRSND